MSLRGQILPVASQLLTSTALARGREQLQARLRRWRGAAREIHWVHQADDPYSHVLAQLLPRLIGSYDAKLRLHLVPPPERAAAPEPEMLARYGLQDAKWLAQAFGVELPADAELPNAERVFEANRRLAAIAEDRPDVDAVIAIGASLWSHEPFAGAAADEAPAHARLAAGQEWRRRRRHYLGGMLFHEGVWYWGADRIGYLGERLERDGARRSGQPRPGFEPSGEVDLPPLQAPLEVFFSFRSPYSAIAMPRVFALARRHQMPLLLRPVLPMVMRGLPVPSAKRMYILMDTKREADRHGVAFGKIVDPVGAGAERCLALACHLRDDARLEGFVTAAMRGIFAEGIEVASDAGLKRIAAGASVSADEVARALADQSWRERVEENRAAMFDAGLWGVPSFRLGQLAVWGQDRFWLLEQALARLDSGAPSHR